MLLGVWKAMNYTLRDARYCFTVTATHLGSESQWGCPGGTDPTWYEIQQLPLWLYQRTRLPARRKEYGRMGYGFITGVTWSLQYFRTENIVASRILELHSRPQDFMMIQAYHESVSLHGHAGTYCFLNGRCSFPNNCSWLLLSYESDGTSKRRNWVLEVKPQA